MSKLIKCPACEKQVSTQAAACPNCGQPLNALLADDVQTVEQTGKDLKLQILISLCLFFGSIPLFVIGAGLDSDAIMNLAGIALLAGLGWYLITRVNIWWKHR